MEGEKLRARLISTRSVVQLRNTEVSDHLLAFMCKPLCKYTDVGVNALITIKLMEFIRRRISLVAFQT